MQNTAGMHIGSTCSTEYQYTGVQDIHASYRGRYSPTGSVTCARACTAPPFAGTIHRAHTVLDIVLSPRILVSPGIDARIRGAAGWYVRTRYAIDAARSAGDYRGARRRAGVARLSSVRPGSG